VGAPPAHGHGRCREEIAGEIDVVSCTLLPYDERFELGATLAEAHKPVHLAHRYCATFCVLGGAGCGQARGGR
jgi:hypothetical protein